MQIIPYVPIPKLKVIGVSFFVIGLAAIGVIALLYHNSGEVVAESETIQPLPKTDISEQAMQAMSQAYLQNQMNKMGLPTIRTDDVETLAVEFHPIHLTPEMGKVTLFLEIKAKGIVARNNMTWTDQDFISTDYNIQDVDTHQIIFNQKSVIKHTVNQDENNHHATISYNARDKKVSSQSLLKYRDVTLMTVPQAGNYVLRANFQKLKFSYPLDSIKLIAKKGMMEKPSFGMIGSFLGIIFFGAILCIMATPPEQRNANKNKKSGASSRKF